MNLPLDQLIITLWKPFKGAFINIMRRRRKEVLLKNILLTFLLIAVDQHHEQGQEHRG